MDASILQGGFTNASQQSALAFRALMNSMARPGTIETLRGAMPPSPLSIAVGTLLLTLADPDTPVFLAGKCDSASVRNWISFHTGAVTCDRRGAVFGVGNWDDLMPLAHYRRGNAEYPDRSTTLFVEVPVLEAKGTQLTGPGIQGRAALSVPDAKALAQNNSMFPLGLDFYFTCGARVAALPRSTRIG
ncbi:MAG: phosphonate C-P lyase system protein PhnH [Pseudomonadota bacterium]